jgi:hypothetical protein
MITSGLNPMHEIERTRPGVCESPTRNVLIGNPRARHQNGAETYLA